MKRHIVDERKSEGKSNRPKVFVQLRYGQDGRRWKEQHQQGLVPDMTPYGYHHAENMGFLVEFSSDRKEAYLVNFLRRGATRILGFDLWHAWRNRREITASDATWTHTEYEHLAVSFLLKLSRTAKRPLLVAQSVWLFDIWASLPSWRRALYRWLLLEADVLTTLTDRNLHVLRSVIPEIRSQTILFGVSLDSFPISLPNENHRIGDKLKVVALGNDEHRDWETLVQAVTDEVPAELIIATVSNVATIIGNSENIVVRPAKNLRQVRRLYSWADVVVVSLKHNLHASGLTVVLEAVASGKPVIASDTGGLRVYFNDDEITYVPPVNSHALKSALLELRESYKHALDKARRAQGKLRSAELTIVGYATRHADLTLELLEQR